VYVIPSFAGVFDVENDLPRHPCLELVHVCYQPLSAELGRRLVVMKRTADYYDPAKRLEYLAAVWKNGPESAEKCANIRDKLLEAAKQKPHYEERAAVRKEKRRQHKEEKKEAKKRAKTTHSANEQGSGNS
jgi:tRNA (guanine10-N2)-methyltransferase